MRADCDCRRHRATTVLHAGQAPVPADRPVAAHRPQLRHRARPAAREGAARPDRRLFRRRLDHPALGGHRLSGVPGALDAAVLRLERRQLRLGRRHDAEHPVAAPERRAGRRASESDRAARRHEQHRQRRGPGSAADRAEDISRGIEAIVDVMRSKAPAATIVLTAIFPRNDSMAAMPVIDETNRRIAALRRRPVDSLSERQRQARRRRAERSSTE